MEDKYKEANLKEYKHWILATSFRQHTLGSFIILAKRPNEKISDLTNEELLELKTVMQETEEALSQTEGFKPQRFNYLQLGNSMNQLHFHGIPRYDSPRNFAGREWVDTTFGGPPIFLRKDQESELELIKQIKESILPTLR